MICPNCKINVPEGEFCPECKAKLLNDAEKDVVNIPTDVKENTVSGTAKKTQNKIDVSKIMSIVKKPFVFIPIIVLVLILVLSIALHKSDETKLCIELINEIPKTVTAMDDWTIEAAESYYDSLEEKDQKKVSNYKKLVEARNKCDELIAQEVVTKIENLSANAEIYEINSVRYGYDNLTENQKTFVSNISVLEEIEVAYYSEFIETAINKIDAIKYSQGPVSSDHEKAYKEAASALEKVPEVYHSKVTNIEKLESIRNAMDKYYLEDAQKLINVSLKEKSGYSKAEEAYNKLTDKQKKLVENYDNFKAEYEEYLTKSPLQLLNYRISENSIGTPTIYLSAKNVGDQIIKEFTVLIFVYDEEGVPVSVGYNDYYKNLSYDDALKIGKKTEGNTYWTLYGMNDKSDIKHVVAIVNEVEFFDGSTWKNPDYSDLLVKYEQQIISTNDPNILTRG